MDPELVRSHGPDGTFGGISAGTQTGNILSKPEWRRLSACWRKDLLLRHLQHEWVPEEWIGPPMWGRFQTNNESAMLVLATESYSLLPLNPNSVLTLGSGLVEARKESSSRQDGIDKNLIIPLSLEQSLNDS